MLRSSEPVVIARVVNDNNVLLANTSTGVIIRKANVSQLKAYLLTYSLHGTESFLSS